MEDIEIAKGFISTIRRLLGAVENDQLKLAMEIEIE